MASNLRVKVCGMSDPDSIRAIAQLSPELMGFIFAATSPRNASHLAPEIVLSLPKNVARVGVFVNAPPNEILATANRFDLNAAQLHGDETPQECEQLKKAAPHLTLIKSFCIDSATSDPFAQTRGFLALADLFLFDTKSDTRGGSGISFDWSVLERYHSPTPFILAGGVGLHNIDRAITLSHTANMWGVDVNSKVEMRPGTKNPDLVSQVLARVRQ